MCRNRYSGEHVVIKLLMPRGGQHSSEFAKSVKETELQQRLAGSKFVASVFSWGTIDSAYLWICMEFCEGGSLTSLINNKRGITGQAKGWCKQLALGLTHMHKLSVMHRDIKPCNILVALDTRNEGTMKYIDFGLALQVDIDQPGAYGRSGTEGYMAPEVDVREPCTPWYTLTADCWSVGIVFFQLLTGTIQSEIPTNRFINERKSAISGGNPSTAVSTASSHPGLDAEAVMLLEMALERDPVKRKTANEIAAFLVSPLSSAKSAV